MTEATRIVAAWASRNSLTLKTKKIRAIVFDSPHTVGLFDGLGYPSESIAKAETVEFVSEIKSLGVHS